MKKLLRLFVFVWMCFTVIMVVLFFMTTSVYLIHIALQQSLFVALMGTCVATLPGTLAVGIGYVAFSDLRDMYYRWAQTV